MKKTKYLVLSAAAILAVGCGSKQMPKISNEDAVTTANKIMEAQVEGFKGGLDETPAIDADIDAWYDWKAPQQYVSVTATDTTNIDYHMPGEAFVTATRTATRTLKYDLEAHRIQYIYDANFYDADYDYEVVEELHIPDYRPGTVHAQYDYIWDGGSGLWCCSDVNGQKYKTLADWDWLWEENYEVIDEVKDADAWIKKAYVYATILNKTFGDQLVAPIPAAEHYMLGFDDMMDYFLNWGDGYGQTPETLYILNFWSGLVYDDFGTYDQAEEYGIEKAPINSEAYPVSSSSVYSYFDTFAQFVKNSIKIRDAYKKDFEEKGGQDFGAESSAKADYFSDKAEGKNNLAGEVAYRLDYKKAASITEAAPAWYYGIDYSFNYADSYLTKSDIKYYAEEQYLSSTGAKTDYYHHQSATKSTTISYDKPSFKEVNVTDYTAYNYFPVG